MNNKIRKLKEEYEDNKDLFNLEIRLREIEKDLIN